MQHLNTILNLLFFPFYFLISFFQHFYNSIHKIKKGLFGVLFLLFASVTSLYAGDLTDLGDKNCTDNPYTYTSSGNVADMSYEITFTEDVIVTKVEFISSQPYYLYLDSSFEGDGWYNSGSSATSHTANISESRSSGQSMYIMHKKDGPEATISFTVTYCVLNADAGPDRAANIGDNVTLDGSGSSGSISSHSWSDGTTTWTGERPDILTTGWSTGNHTITLTVTDNHGNTDTDTVIITLSTAGGDGDVGSGLFGTSHCGPINTLYEDQCLIQDDLCGIYLQSGNEIIGAVNGELDTPALSGDPDAICRETPGGDPIPCISTGGGVDQIHFDVGKLGGTGVDISTLSNITTYNGDAKIEGNEILSDEIIFVNNGKLLLGENSSGTLSIDGEVEIHIKPSGGIGDTALILDFSEIEFQTYDSTLKIFSEGAIEIKGPIQIGIANYNYSLKGISLGDLKHPTVNFQILSKGDVIIRDAHPLRGLIYTDTIVDIGSSEVYGSLIGSRVYSSSSGPAITVDASENEGCGADGGPPPYLTGPFDAWDTFRGDTDNNGLLDDRNISTKIAAKQFDLIIASLDANNTGIETKSGIDIRYRLIDMDTGVRLGTLQAFNADADSSITDSFTVNEAHRRLAVEFTVCADYNATGYTFYPYDDCILLPTLGCSTCPADYNKIGYRNFNSTDLFAVRPNKFVLSASGLDIELLKSAATYNFTVIAEDENGSATNDYNQTKSGLLDPPNKALIYNDGIEDDGTTGRDPLAGDLQFSSSDFSFDDGISVDSSGNNEVVGISFDDVAIVTIQPEDRNWAAIDSDDSPQDCNETHQFNNGLVTLNDPNLEDAYICGEQNATFIPDHFKVENIHLRNHRDGNFTYLSNDLNMSTHIDVNISARNANDNITQNFRENNTIYYENPVSVDLNVTEWLGVASRHPKGNSVHKHDIPTQQLLGFGGSDANGTHSIAWKDSNTTQRLMFNYDRQNNQTVNPFEIDGTDINITVASRYPASDTTTDGNTADITDSGIGDQNATFYFARAKVAKADDFYDGITASSQNTPITVRVYCKLPFPFTCSNWGIDTINGLTDDDGWWLSMGHNDGLDDGNVTLVSPPDKLIRGTGHTPTVTTDISITSGGSDDTVPVTRGGDTDLPMTVGINLDTSSPTDTNSWLIYHPTADGIGAPSPFYRVKFIGDVSSSNWTGHGKTGHVVDSNSSRKKNNRLGW